MQLLSLLLYGISVRLYGLGILLASLFNAKAKLWIEGRKNQSLGVIPQSKPGAKRIWVHCASLGEFEQARPLIEKIKANNPAAFIILTFFSPSGYEVRKKYSTADVVLYLPLDTPGNAKKFIDYTKPDLALFVKYEFWYYYLAELKSRKITTVLFAAMFRKEQVFFKWYGRFFRNTLQYFDKIFVQNKESQRLLNSISIESEVSFDTRFDRVFEIAETARLFPEIARFKGDSKLLIAGSTWKKDERLIAGLINQQVLKNYKYIIAPHNLNEDEIAALQKEIQVTSVRFSQLNDINAKDTGVIIVDTIGDLSSIYRYGDIAYVGGAFNASVHNVLEPAVYGLPIIFGPNYLKSAEAIELVNLKAAFSITDEMQLQTIVTKLNDDAAIRQAASRHAEQYVKTRLGGVADIYNYIAPYIKN